MDYLALTIGNQTINAPAGLPSGGTNTLSKVLGNALSMMLILAAILCLIYLILGGIQWTQSGGDKGKVAGARAKITYAIIGLVVALAAFLIINVFGYFFGVKLIGQ